MKFRDLRLLDQALTHASVASELPEPPANYEPIEFLGDAVLGLAIAHLLYERMPEQTPGEYSRLRAELVNRRSLAKLARQLEIAPLIRLGRGEEMSGGRERVALLADCFEAMLGAVYLDAGWETAYLLVRRVFSEELKRLSETDRNWDFKSRLQNFCQAEHILLPKFNVVRSEGPDHRKKFEVEVMVDGRVVGRGRGTSKKEAEQNAARLALESGALRTLDSAESNPALEVAIDPAVISGLVGRKTPENDADKVGGIE
jgi:ribonuclease-3